MRFSLRELFWCMTLIGFWLFFFPMMKLLVDHRDESWVRIPLEWGIYLVITGAGAGLGAGIGALFRKQTAGAVIGGVLGIVVAINVASIAGRVY